MARGAALIFDLVAKGNAPAEFLKLAGAADKAAASTAKAEAGLATASARMSKHGATLTKGFTLPLLAIGAVGVSQAAKWQSSMTLIQTAGGETAAKAAVLSKGLLKIAAETGTSLSQLGEGIYTVAKAGAQKWSATDQLIVMKAAAQGAKSEHVDLGVATDALSTIMLDYHLNASKAVETENELIRASGLAKTNFSDFASSLSNVMPIASALGVKQAEILGGLATMTQHGVKPQQASENMRNLLFNLSGQNNVASQAMQQLGINTVDLTKHLGNRGLTGTLAIVDKALKDHTHNGMIVIDVHKAAALATGSLNTMLGDMTGKLRGQSAGLLSGAVGIKDYTKYAKGMGGQAGASALQFLALYKNSEGFSNQLKSGKGTITTSTAQYAKLLGGMTGAAVAMQIGGKYAADNARNVREVGKAALEAGTDVLGWNKTQDTLAVKLDKAKASLQVMAVEIGTALIPVVSKVVGWVQSAVTWFDSLGSGWKKFIGYSAVFLAALGPVLSIGSKIVRLYSGVASAFDFFAKKMAGGATATSAANVEMSTSSARATAAMKVAEAEKAAAVATSSERIALSLQGTDSVLAESAAAAARDAAAFAEAMAAEADAAVLSASRITAAQSGLVRSSAASSAAMRESAAASGGGIGGGAVGVGRGGAAGAGRMSGGTMMNAAGAAGTLGYLGYGAADHMGKGNKALDVLGTLGGGSTWMADQIARVTGFGQRASAKGDSGKSYNIVSGLDGTRYAVDNKSASALVATLLHGKTIAAAFNAVLDAGGPAAKANALAAAQAIAVNSGLAKKAKAAGLTEKDLANAITGNAAAYNRVVAAWKAGGNPSKASLDALALQRTRFTQATAAAKRYADVHGIVYQDEMKAVNATALLSGKLGNFNTQNLTGAKALGQFRGMLGNVSDSVRKNGATLDANTSFGQHNIAMLRAAATASLAHAQAVYQQTGSLAKSESALKTDRAELIKTARQSGLSAKAASAVADALFGIPANRKSKVTVDTAAAERNLLAVQSTLAGIVSKRVQVSVDTYNIRHAGGGGLKLQYNGSGSGGIPEGWSSINERGSELLHKSGNRVDVVPHGTSVQMLAAAGMRVPGFAAGTAPFHASPIMPAQGRDRVADLLASIDRKLDQLRQVGPDLADALHGAARTAAHNRQTIPAGRNW